MPALTLDDLEALQARSADATVIAVEGERRAGDAWIYGDCWFSDLAGSVRFYPARDWRTVCESVAAFREEYPNLRIFGIVDRDFDCTKDHSELLGLGVHRLARYSVENYLLDPPCWARLAERIAAIHCELPAGWATEDQVCVRITEAYARLAPAAAFNRVLAEYKSANPASPVPTYISSRGDGRLKDPLGALAGLPGDPGAAYSEALRALASGSDALHEQVNGKWVFDELRRSLIADCGLKTSIANLAEFKWNYLNLCPDPPDEVRELIERLAAP